ncbi:MAG: hypothetical protein IJM38_06025 [Ruminococcus sp.]|nr:hypothetical protein [Ruminococcus sp.]
MDLIFDFILELLFDAIGTGISDASKSSKIPKPVRYILLLLILLFWTAFFALIFFVGAILLQKSVIGGIIVIVLGALMLFLAIKKLKKNYSRRK